MTTPNAKRDRGSTSDSACANDLDEAASVASSVVEKDVDMKYLTGTSKEVHRTHEQRRRGVHDDWQVDRVRLHASREASPRGASTIGSQPSYPQSTESSSRSVSLSCPDPFCFHHVLSTFILAASRVTDDGDVHPDVVCQ